MNKRNLAIDIFRGLTMALMVFVNDFWTILDVPHWMEHFQTMEDGMGLSDIVYPMFLFAMGMSVPYAIERRYAKGFSGEDTLRHILSRTAALLLMGAFIVNSEIGVVWNKGVYWLIMIAGFFLVWNAYPKDFRWGKALRLVGVLLLTGLALAYRSPDGGLFRASWWGILGQIGWMYLFAALAYLLCRNRKWILAVLWVLFCLINLSVCRMRGGEALTAGNFLADAAGALNLGNGHSIIMALGGMLTVLADQYLRKARVASAMAATAVLLALGFATHTGWIISKNLGTLPWCLFVSAISVALYTLLRVMENKGWTAWSNPLKPAGTATLTVYMMPYIFYSFWVFLSPEIPQWLSGGVGLLKCALFSALCIACTWGLNQVGIKLKI